jgi:ketosteroid isomerase-like protein
MKLRRGGSAVISASELFPMADRRAVGARFAENATMVFGDGDPMYGRAAIEAGNAAFFAAVKGLSHQVRREWTAGDTAIAVTDVTCTRLDDKRVTLPAVSIWRVGADGLIADFRVYADLAPVFA